MISIEGIPEIWKRRRLEMQRAQIRRSDTPSVLRAYISFKFPLLCSERVRRNYFVE